MTRCHVGHATHPDWAGALALAGAQLDAQQTRAGAGAGEPALGLVYFTDRYAPHADALYAALHARWPGVAWAGTWAWACAPAGVEYFDEPGAGADAAHRAGAALRVFSGKRPLSNIAPATRWCMPTATPTTCPSCWPR
jgi:hypothetical protein